MNIFIEAAGQSAAAVQVASVNRFVRPGVAKTITTYVGRPIDRAALQTLIASVPPGEPGMFLGRGVVAVSECQPFNGMSRLAAAFQPVVISWTDRTLLTFFSDESVPFSCEFETLQQDIISGDCGRVRRIGDRFITANNPLGLPMPDEVPCWESLGAQAAKGRCLAGTALKKLLAGPPFWFKDAKDCGCSGNASKMDSWGCDECERREDEILGWLRDAASKRGLPFSETVGRWLIRTAIARARRAVV